MLKIGDILEKIKFFHKKLLLFRFKFLKYLIKRVLFLIGS